MKDNRLTMAIIYGGRSAEHEVSLRSAASVFNAVSTESYDLVPVLITPQGAWYKMPADVSSFAPTTAPSARDRLIFSPDPADRGFLLVGDPHAQEPLPVDLVFPVLHGTYGEDGTIQGLFELANMPYVGCGVLASAVGMDKVLMKCAFQDNGLFVGPFFWFLRSEWEKDKHSIFEKMASREFPLFVKPANLGSSVGISRVCNSADFEKAVSLALSYDRKVLVEDAIVGRELEVSVLGNDEPIASVAGEVIAHSDFYDYEEKYLRDTAELIIPAKISGDDHERAGKAAEGAFRAVDGSGLARVDMFLTPDGRIVINEINTLPGFTSISMYPKLWEATGVAYDRLVDKLVELALERYRVKQLVRTDR